MAYLALDKILEARTYVEENIKKPDTFMGLVLFLLCVVERKRNGSYLKSDMKQFSELADAAFYLSDTRSYYSDKYWFALLTNDWVDQVKDYFLKGNKVSANKVMQSLFWLDSFSELQLKTNLIPKDIFDELFISDLDESDFNQASQVRKADLLSSYGGNQEALTIKFDGSFVKKKAGDLSGAPFGQTLYAATEIKKIISVFDFDFIEKFDLTGTNKTYNYSMPSSEVCLSKPFLLLAGISGTGKTRFVREQAKTSKQFTETYCLTSVRPDWHEPSDLLGYISRLNGTAEYITTDVLQFIAKAWRAIADSGLTVAVQESKDLGKRLVVSGERDALEQVLPYWLCLDEMNLAPVEQYFADYLSVLETREWCWKGDSFTYSCDALLKPATIKEIADKEKLREALGFENSENKNYDELWQLICQYGLGIPFNLLVAGTVNMDETTHGFSRKVIDRALSFDFGEFFPNNIDEFFAEGGRTRSKRLSYPLISHAKLEKFKDVEADNDAEKTKAFFKAINNVLKQTPFELAFRAFNELCLSVITFSPKTPKELAAVFDDFLMCKVLPRIEGDEDKLVTADNNNVLVALMDVLETELNQIWPTPEVVNLRPDLLQCKEHDPESVLEIPCRSKTKLEWMNKQLNNGFCSFWP
ncbi:putative enzyme [Vibrio aestuarianus]|nr:putative enzyme [Vibrio aestuarianus]